MPPAPESFSVSSDCPAAAREEHFKDTWVSGAISPEARVVVPPPVRNLTAETTECAVWLTGVFYRGTAG